MKIKLSPLEREALLLGLLSEFFRDQVSTGKLLRRLRKDMLNMSQEEFSSLVKISRRTLSDIETDKGSQSLSVLGRVFRLFGLKIGLLPRSQQLLKKILEKEFEATDEQGKVK
ncbi:helix-turn-helix transcriptional regulator [Yersinia kristensenii]|uniref:helix-turn-helix transcriptional regulator n=1 Tax=Yersinia kristensenii TaxID=28152 RepID=UPI000B7393A9|nr:helix-turn-helix transcriptional regulator [Yersinia kristensenii]MBW5810869.1 helix-turn-helix transcriptional regulator [Yersinia kristensenii]MBW5817590.1 helix-turn-helix transcriptional regulator [Yersinia kristensenii]MBW5827700.1 helix-turn-helix transcriptional regulator [Yersinia kristensenii]MBW5842535.1 helix-turn-helix transcriptional regulator [Yersinia kristensenii]MDA5488589.1 helix-turn-helix transcriptional regulator [Yersinia kristensenii]